MQNEIIFTKTWNEMKWKKNLRHENNQKNNSWENINLLSKSDLRYFQRQKNSSTFS